MFKHITGVGLAAAIALSISVAPVQAGNTGRNIAFGIIAGVGAAAAFAAATQAAKRREHHESYLYDDGISALDNAVAACLHKAHRSVLLGGGDGIEFVHLERSKRKSNGWIIGAHVNTYGPWGVERRYAKCRIRHDRVTRLSWH